MNRLSLSEIIMATNGKQVKYHEDQNIERICIDTRIAKSGDLFIPIIGETHDGHKYVTDAFENGVKNFLIDKNHELTLDNVNIIEVEDTTVALGQIAKYYRNKFEIPFIGITGSTGKTTTKAG